MTHLKKTHSLEGTVTNVIVYFQPLFLAHIYLFFFAQIKWKQFRFAFVQMEALAHFCSCTAIIVQLNYPALCNFHWYMKRLKHWNRYNFTVKVVWRATCTIWFVWPNSYIKVDWTVKLLTQAYVPKTKSTTKQSRVFVRSVSPKN